MDLTLIDIYGMAGAQFYHLQVPMVTQVQHMMYMYIILGIRMTSLWIKTKALLEVRMGACSTIVFIVAKNSNIRHCLSFIKCIKLQATPKYYATINKF